MIILWLYYTCLLLTTYKYCEHSRHCFIHSVMCTPKRMILIRRCCLFVTNKCLQLFTLSWVDASLVLLIYKHDPVRYVCLLRRSTGDSWWKAGNVCWRRKVVAHLHFTSLLFVCTETMEYSASVCNKKQRFFFSQNNLNGIDGHNTQFHDERVNLIQSNLHEKNTERRWTDYKTNHLTMHQIQVIKDSAYCKLWLQNHFPLAFRKLIKVVSIVSKSARDESSSSLIFEHPKRASK